MNAEPHPTVRRAGTGPRRALLVSVAFPLAAWFVASRPGLVVALIAVAIWWVASRPRLVCWAACVGCLAAAPVALFLQGLPGSRVVGADFGTRHWVANDLVIAALLFGAFAALMELLGMDVRRASSGRLSRLGRLVGERARGVPLDGNAPDHADRAVDHGAD